MAVVIASAGVAACGHAGDDDLDSVESALAPGQGDVHGWVDVKLKDTMALPDAGIQLKRTSDGLLSSLVTSDVNGHYIVSNVPIGTYNVCIASTQGFANACSGTSVVVASGKIAYAPHAVFTPSRFTLAGRVVLADGRDVLYASQQFARQVDTTAKLVTSTGTLVSGPVRANSHGQFVLRQLALGSYRLIVQSETTTIDQPVTVSDALTTLNLTLPNRRPTVQEINVLQGGKTARHAAAGSKVDVSVRASDPDGQALHYSWIAPAGGSCPTTDAAAVSCTMPTAQGLQSIYVQISDGAGQYETAKVRVAVGPAISLFSGRALDGGTGVAGAEVKVNGVLTTTNATGGFALSVTETDRYVLTIKKDGYQLLSKVFQEERPDALYPLLRAELTTIDPTIDNSIAVRPPKSPYSGQIDYKAITVVLKAGTIVDAAGNKVTTPVNVYRSRFDHLADPFVRMPGDFGATTKDGKDVTLTSFGALDLTLRGPAGQKYNLAAGATADLDYPVPSSQLASAPATLPLWYYNEDTGLWQEDGVATFNGSSYKAQAKHFTAINVDLQKSNATCLKVVIDQASFPHLPVKLRLSVPGSPTVERNATERVNAIVRLPPNVAGSTLSVIDPGTNAPYPGSTQTFSTGSVLPDGTNLSLASPYDVCITAPSPTVIMSLNLPHTPSPPWLTYLQNPGATDADRDAYASAYYTAINAETTLGAWQMRNEFPAGDDAHGWYFNAGDLEFGRSMHMKHKSDGGIAFYVTNYETADKAFGGAPGDVIATVAMEFSKFPQTAIGAPKFTKFYVFDKNGNRSNSAELDNRGAKFVPGLCVVCHGGTLPTNIAGTTPAGNTESHFIPFDLKSFDLNPTLNPGFPSAAPRSTQEDQFRLLNQGVYLNTNATDAQKAIIEAWYAPGDVSTPMQPEVDGNIPFFWSSSSTVADPPFYTDVIRPSCRSCHASRLSPLDFGDPTSFNMSYGGIVPIAVCNVGFMPQSFVTWRNFWQSQSPHQPTRVEQYFGLPANSCVGP